MNVFARALGALAFVMVSGAVLPVGAQQTRDNRQEMERPEVRELRILGVRSVDEDQLRDGLVTEESGCKWWLYRPVCAISRSPIFFERHYLDREEFERDVIRLLVFYFRRGYRHAQVDTTVERVDDNAVRITMAVTEGPPTVITSAVVQGAANVLSARDTSRHFRPKAGEPFNVFVLDSSLVQLRELLWERGYANAVITPEHDVSDTLRTADIRITIDPGKLVTIGSIEIEGEDRIDESVVRRSLRVEPGDLFRYSRIQRSQRSLYESFLFRRALIDTVSAGDSVKNLRITVIEAPQREARTSFGFTTADFVQAEAAFTHHYLFDGPRRLDANLTIGNLLAQQLTKSRIFVDITDLVPDNQERGRYYAPTYVASVDVRQRWFQSPRNTIGAGVFSHRRSAPGVFVDHGFGANATFTREVADRTPLSATYRFEITRVEAGDVYFCVNYGVCDMSTIVALRGQQRLSPVALTLSTNHTDAPLSPTRGYRASAEAEHASAATVSDFRYNRLSLDVAGYLPLPFRRAVGAARLRAGWVRPLGTSIRGVDEGVLGSSLLHPRKRFYAGGSQSVRGFGENQLGPRVLTIAPETLLRGEYVEDDQVLYRCALDIPIESCDVNAEHLRDEDFQTRPLGGTSLVEGSVEVRVPMFGNFVGAAFVDGAILGGATFAGIRQTTTAFTPGVGVRYESPVGPIRVDLGFRPKLQESLPVVTEVRDEDGRLQLISLSPTGGCPTRDAPGCRVHPVGNERNFFRRLAQRMTIHLSIGQAF